MCVAERQPILQVPCDAQLLQQFAIPRACQSPDATYSKRLRSQHMKQKEDQKQENQPAKNHT